MARPGRARDALVALQVTGAVLLLICAAVFLRSSWAAATVDPRYPHGGCPRSKGPERAEARGHPRSDSGPSRWSPRLRRRGRRGWAGAPHLPRARVASRLSRTSSSRQSTLAFTTSISCAGAASRRASAAQASRWRSCPKASRASCGPAATQSGRSLRVEPERTKATQQPDDPPLVSRAVVVVGVARDVAGVRIGDVRLDGAGVYMPISAEAAKTSLTMRVRGDSERARHALVDRLAAIDPNMGEVSSLETIRRGAEYLLGIPFWLTLALGALALLLTLSGLFSVLSYLVEQRTQGDRRADGAWRNQRKHRRARAVSVGSSCRHRAAPRRHANGRDRRRAAGDACRRTDRIGRASLRSVAYAVSLVCIVTACTCAALIPALRAARIDPVGALKQH